MTALRLNAGDQTGDRSNFCSAHRGGRSREGIPELMLVERSPHAGSRSSFPPT